MGGVNSFSVHSLQRRAKVVNRNFRISSRLGNSRIHMHDWVRQMTPMFGRIWHSVKFTWWKALHVLMRKAWRPRHLNPIIIMSVDMLRPSCTKKCHIPRHSVSLRLRSTCPSLCTPVCRSVVHLSIRQSSYPYIYPSVCSFIAPARARVRPSIYPPICT